MIKEIKVYSRLEMKEFIYHNGIGFPYENWYLISIHGGDILVNKHTRRVFESIGCKGLISLNFADMTEDDQETVLFYNSKAILFNQDHAKKIIKFIDNIQKDKNDSVLVVHCHAGISRSGAVGAFACDYCGLDYNDFLSKNSQIQPNPHVTRILRKEANMNPSFMSETSDEEWLKKINKILEEK